MNLESSRQSQNLEKSSSGESFDLSYTIDTSRENKVIYLFNNVAVVIDKSGKNIKDVPEILFGVFPNSPQGDILSQPQTPVEGVTMKYITACIKKVVEDCGERELWFHPYGEDVEEGQRQKREQSRYRLFSQYADIKTGPEGYGYIIKI